LKVGTGVRPPNVRVAAKGNGVGVIGVPWKAGRQAAEVVV